MNNKYKILSYLVIILIIISLLIIKDAVIVWAQKLELSRGQVLEKSKQHFQQGEAFYNQGDYSRADEEFRKAQELLEGLKQQEADIEQEIKEEDSFIEDMSAEPEVENYDEYLKKALAFAKSGESERAISHYQKAIVLAPDKSNLHYNLAIEYLKTKQFTQAAEELNKVIRLNPKDKDAYYNLGVLYENYLRDIKRARFYYLRYIKFAPQAADIDNVKAWIRQIDSEIKLGKKRDFRQR